MAETLQEMQKRKRTGPWTKADQKKFLQKQIDRRKSKPTAPKPLNLYQRQLDKMKRLKTEAAAKKRKDTGPQTKTPTIIKSKQLSASDKRKIATEKRAAQSRLKLQQQIKDLKRKGQDVKARKASEKLQDIPPVSKPKKKVPSGDKPGMRIGSQVGKSKSAVKGRVDKTAVAPSKVQAKPTTKKKVTEDTPRFIRGNWAKVPRKKKTVSKRTDIKTYPIKSETSVDDAKTHMIKLKAQGKNAAVTGDERGSTVVVRPGSLGQDAINRAKAALARRTKKKVPSGVKPGMRIGSQAAVPYSRLLNEKGRKVKKTRKGTGFDETAVAPSKVQAKVKPTAKKKVKKLSDLGKYVEKFGDKRIPIAKVDRGKPGRTIGSQVGKRKPAVKGIADELAVKDKSMPKKKVSSYQKMTPPGKAITKKKPVVPIGVPKRKPTPPSVNGSKVKSKSVNRFAHLNDKKVQPSPARSAKMTGKLAEKHEGDPHLIRKPKAETKTIAKTPKKSKKTLGFRKISGPDDWSGGIREYETPFGNITVDSLTENLTDEQKERKKLGLTYKKGGQIKVPKKKKVGKKKQGYKARKDESIAMRVKKKRTKKQLKASRSDSYGKWGKGKGKGKINRSGAALVAASYD